MLYFSICYPTTLQYIEITFLYFHMIIIHPEFGFLMHDLEKYAG